MSHLTLATLILFLAASAVEAANENTTFVLHAVDAPFVPCDQVVRDGVDCESILPVVEVADFQYAGVLVLLRNYDSVIGAQCAFDWPSSWIFLWSMRHCQSGEPVYGTSISGPGPVQGTLVVGFDPIIGGVLAPIARLHFLGPSEGCLGIIESAFPYGTHVLGPSGEISPIPQANRARVCVGPGGYTACDPSTTAVSSSTWGSIKNQFH